VADFLQRLLQALLSSLYVVLGRVPAVEQLRRAFAGSGAGGGGEGLLLLVLLALAAGVILFFLFLRTLRRTPAGGQGRTLKEIFRGGR
jgi:hypothetical protein